MSPSLRRIIALSCLALCAMGLSACQTTGAPGSDVLGTAQNSARAAALGAGLHQAQAKSLSTSPKQATRPNQPIVIGIGY
jgi:predicted small secreted protein